MLILRFFITFLLLLSLGGCNGIANGWATKNQNYLFEPDKHIGDIYLGKTSLTYLKNKYGGVIQRIEESDGSSNSLCLIFRRADQSYALHLISGAMGGWDTVTEYDIAEITNTYSEGGCGKYDYAKISIGWIKKKLESAINKYGLPKTRGKDFIEYTYSYQEKPSKLDVYSGITFYFDDKKKIYRFNVFEVKSN